MKKQQGFTLMELMIAVGLVAILLAMAIPSYSQYLQRTARASAESDLMRAANQLERLKAQNFSYTGASLGTTTTSTVFAYSPFDGTVDTKKYDITLVGISSTGAAVALTGTPPAIPAGVVGWELTATSTGNFKSGGQTEVLKYDYLGRKCYKALGVSVTTCTYGTDPTWP